MKTKNHHGFAALESLLILVILAILGFTGWYIYNSSKKTNKSLDNTSSLNAGSAAKSKSEVSLSEYKSDALSLKFTYPKNWGDASVTKGDLVSPQHGSYQQLTFSRAASLDIDFVTGPYDSPLDGCGLSAQPVQAEIYSLTSKRASVIGWDKDNLKLYMDGQGFNGPTIYPVSLKPSDNSTGFNIVSTDSTVLAYQDKNAGNWKVSGDNSACGTFTQAEADQANTYAKFYHYAVNYSNSNVKGVNAHYDYRKGDDANARKQLITALNSLKDN